LLPNAFTTAALFAGFFAILQAVQGNWQAAALAVVVAAVLDACDGRVARWTGTQSSFGAEYDSLADVISFGVAPALIMYQWSLMALGKIGLGAAFCYCAATALRLARFNVQSGGDKRFFIGFPSPAAAILSVSVVATIDAVYGVDYIVSVGTAVLAILLAGTMVSGVLFYSFKDVNIKKRIPFRYVVFFFLAAAGVYQIADNLMEVLSVLLGGYFASGYGILFWKKLIRKQATHPPRRE
jgi:CDP-diacylglycerol--serine O-phosphatidyltransferase